MNCGRGSLHREHPEHPGVWQHLRTSCKKLSCPDCGPVKCASYRRAVFDLAKQHGLRRHVTLTLDPGLIPADVDSVTYIAQVWNRYKTELERHYGLKLTWLRVLEFQGNGTAHYHLLIKETVTQDTLLQAWVSAGGGHQVRIRFRDGTRGASYVTKYVTKELMANIPPGRRVITTTRLMRLFPPHVPSGWQWNRYPLWIYICEDYGLQIKTLDTFPDPRYYESGTPPLEHMPDERKR